MIKTNNTPHQENPCEYDHETADVPGRRRLPLLPPAPGHPVGGAEVLEGGGRGVGAAAARRGASSPPPEEVGGGDQEGPHAGQERRQTEVQRALLHSGECIYFLHFFWWEMGIAWLLFSFSPSDERQERDEADLADLVARVEPGGLLALEAEPEV